MIVLIFKNLFSSPNGENQPLTVVRHLGHAITWRAGD